MDRASDFAYGRRPIETSAAARPDGPSSDPSTAYSVTMQTMRRGGDFPSGWFVLNPRRALSAAALYLLMRLFETAAAAAATAAGAPCAARGCFCCRNNAASRRQSITFGGHSAVSLFRAVRERPYAHSARARPTARARSLAGPAGRPLAALLCVLAH